MVITRIVLVLGFIKRAAVFLRSVFFAIGLPQHFKIELTRDFLDIEFGESLGGRAIDMGNLLNPLDQPRERFLDSHKTYHSHELGDSARQSASIPEAVANRGAIWV